VSREEPDVVNIRGDKVHPSCVVLGLEGGVKDGGEDSFDGDETNLITVGSTGTLHVLAS